MTELYDPTRHQPLADSAWDATRARAVIQEIVADTESAFEPERLWPAHPLDAGDDTQVPAKTLYLGAAGVIWAIEHLREHGWAAPGVSWRDQLGVLAAAYRDQPDTGSPVPSYFLGEVGILAVAAADPDRMFELIESNIGNPTLEALWGAPGTMLPALFEFRATGEERWRDLWLRNARDLIASWQYHEDAGCHLWTQDLYDEKVRLLGAGHGFAGNVFALAGGLDLLAPAEAEQLVARARTTLAATALRRDGLTNWRPHVGQPRAGREAILVQWCHGAPGMITSLAGLPADPEMDRLLVEGGELVWAAGPLAKGPGLCHGTAGNGYAFLALHGRTGEGRWLERARRFAAHAIGQWQAARAAHGRGRHSLWTGDLGLALYLADCADGVNRLPSLDYL